MRAYKIDIVISRGILLLIFLLIRPNLNAQTTLESQILDSSGDPIPFAHIYHEQTRSGTISNVDGFFILNIPTEDLDSKVKVSSIGFTERVLTLNDIKQTRQIVLKDWIGQLETVTITPKNYELELFEKALDRIPNNYPDREMSQGFVKEQLYFLGRKDNPIYIAEATIESIKENYENKQPEKGEVKLLKGRKFQSPQMDSLNLSIYAGIFAPFRFDKVYTRSYVFSGKSLDNYELSISDTLSLEGVELYVLDFKPLKKKLPQGTVYILDSTYAIVKSHFLFNKSAYESNSKLNLSSINRQFLEEETEYYQANDGLWRMKLSTYNTSFEQKDSILFLENNYVVTKTSNEFDEIPYLKKSQYGDYFLNNTGTYDPDFWDNANVILSDSISESLFKNYEDTDKGYKRTRQIEIAQKISTSFGVMYSFVKTEPHDIFFSNDELTVITTSGGSALSSWSLFHRVKYEIKPKFYLGYEVNWSLRRKLYHNIDIVMRKDFNLNPNGRPVLLSPEINIGYQTFGYYIGNFQTENSFELNNHVFDNGKTDIFLLARGFHLQPSISIEIEQSRSTHFFLRGGYNLFLENKTGLLFKEADQFFLKNKARFVENNSNSIEITSTGDVFINRLNLSFGIVLGLDL